MSYEILYTSAPSGLKPGSSGYCTVQGSRGIPAPAVDLLESLSGYRHVFTPGSPEATHNPVNWGHYLIRVAGRVEHVLSRVGDCDLDYTGRSNKLAHHLVVDAPTTATLPGGPAWFLSRPSLMYDQWDGTVSHLGTPRIPPPERRTAGQCAAWGGATGDAGWGGVLAESFLADPERKVFVVYAPGTNVLALFEEAIALLPEHRRWGVTFATYGAALPKTVDSLWSGLIAGSPEVAQSHRFVNALRIDLTTRVGRAVGGPLVELARTGATTVQTRPAARAVSSSSVAPATESVYDGGYQPVPPPPSTFSSQQFSEESVPPSLPRRDERSGRWTVAAYIAGALAITAAAVVTAVFVFLKKQAAPSIESSSDVVQVAAPPSTAVATGRDSQQPRPQTEQAADGRSDLSQSDSKDNPSMSGSPAGPAAEGTTPGDMKGKPPSPLPASEEMPPQEEKQKSPPTAVASEKVPAGAEERRPEQQQGMYWFASERTPAIKEGPGKTAIPLSNPDSISFQEVSGTLLYVPRLRKTKSDKQCLLDVGKQAFRDGNCEIKGGSASWQPVLAYIEIASPLKKPFSVVIGPTTDCESHHFLSLSFGGLLIEDKIARTRNFLQFSGPKARCSTAQVAADHISIQAPAGTNDFTAAVEPNEIVVSNPNFDLGGSPLSPSPEKDGAYSMSTTNATEGVFKSLTVRRPSIGDAGEMRFRLEWTPPIAAVNSDTEKEEHNVSTLWKAVGVRLGDEKVRALPPELNHEQSEMISPEKTDQAILALQTAVMSLPESTPIEKDAKQKAKIDSDQYSAAIKRFRLLLRARHIATTTLRLRRADFQYRVWPIKSNPKDKATVGLASAATPIVVDLFEFSAPETK